MYVVFFCVYTLCFFLYILCLLCLYSVCVPLWVYWLWLCLYFVSFVCMVGTLPSSSLPPAVSLQGSLQQPSSSNLLPAVSLQQSLSSSLSPAISFWQSPSSRVCFCGYWVWLCVYFVFLCVYTMRLCLHNIPCTSTVSVQWI